MASSPSVLREPALGAAAQGEFRTAWQVLLACCFGVSVGAGAYPLYIVPVMALRLEETFGWSRLETSSLTSIGFVGAAMGAPIAGWLNDRWSVRAPAVLATAVIGGVLLLAAFAPPNLLAWQVGIFLMMLLGAGSLSTSYSKIICAAFFRRRGLALGLTIGSVSFVSAVALPLLDGVLRAAGLKTFFLTAGAVYLLAFVPLLLVTIPSGAARREPEVAGPEAAGVEAKAAPSTLALLATGGLLIAIVAGAAGHLAGFAKDADGASPALVGSVFAFGVLIARPVTGYLLDQVQASRVAAVTFALGAAGLLLAALGGAEFAVVSALLLATAVGADLDVMAYLASRHVGPAAFGRFFGWLTCGILLAAASGPVAFAILRSQFGNYEVPFLVAAVVAAAAAGMMLKLPLYDTPSDRMGRA